MFYVVGLLGTAAIVEACLSLTSGQEKEMVLRVDGITLPMEFTYSQTRNVTEQYPMVQTTSEKAVTNIQQCVKNAVSKAIKKFAEEYGYNGYETEIGKQITATVHYNPLLCYAMEPEPTVGISMLTYSPGMGYFCLSKKRAVTKVLYGDKQEFMADIPQEYEDFIVFLKVTS